MQQPALNLIYFLAAVGALFILVFLLRTIWALLKLLRPRLDIKSTYGPSAWALITGASDGIGLGFAQQLVRQGVNVCLVARNPQKCKKVEQDLKGINPEIHTRVVTADFVNCQEKTFFEKILQQTSDLDIGILINNVGMSNMDIFHQINCEKLINEINVNCVPMVVLTNKLIPRMLTRPYRSAIINLSSVAGLNPIPYISVYSATKAFNDFFSKAIGLEYEDKIDVLSVQPMMVQSNMSKANASDFTVATRNQCALASLGQLGREYQTNGYWVHSMLSGIVSSLPTGLNRYLSKKESGKLLEKQKARK